MKKELRIVFLGTPEFAVECLKSLIEADKNVVGVITSPDRQAGRGRKVQQSAVKKYALEIDLPILQPTNLKSPDFIEELRKWNADIQIVVAFRMLPELVWAMPKYGTFNLHASLLPQYRGAAPINWAIINGESKTGVTTFFLKHKIDTGDILFQKEVEIVSNETAGSLHDKLMVIGGDLVLKTLEAIENKKIETKAQEELLIHSEQLREAPKIFRDDCKIDWSKNTNQIDRLVRGLSPYPAAWTKIVHFKSGKELNLKIFEIEIQANYPSLKKGDILVHDNQIIVGAENKSVSLIDLQVEGKKRMKAKELLNGFQIADFTVM